MSPLVRAALVVRHAASHSAILVAPGALAALVVIDAASPLPSFALVAAGLVALVAGGLAWRRRGRDADSSLADAELAALALVTVFAVLGRLDGGVSGVTYGAVLVVVAIASAASSRGVAIFTVACLAALETLIRFFGEGLHVVPIATHVALAAAVATINHALLRGAAARVHEKVKARVEIELARQKDAARSYRLLSAPRSGTAGNVHRADEERLARSSVEEIHQAVLFSLELVRRSLGLHTAMLLWQNDAGTHLRVSELSSDDGDVLDGPFLAGDGIFGAALAQRGTVALANLRSGYKLPYYAGVCPVAAVCAMPVLEHGEIRGLLVVDRVENQAFSPREQELLLAATRHAVRAIQNERVFILLERAKVEQGKLYRAAEALGAAVIEADVVEAAVRSAREIAAFDFAAVTLFDGKDRTHEIRAVSGDDTEELLGKRFVNNNGLVAMVVQNRHPLPYKGELDQSRPQMVFSSKLPMPSMPSVLVLPLTVHDRPLGTLVLGARRRGAFGDAVRPTLEVLARHVAVSLANARMVKKLEELATTDGLTGLLNKRAMFEAAQEKIASASRFQRKLSVLITDIDFFKKVNDNYGHDVGDQVIKGLGDILKRVKRTTDVVARFGGEEFVVLCEETDENGAMLLAERIREEVASTVFPTPKGPLRVTCSLGVSTFPSCGKDWDALFKAADEALYESKEGGRNRVSVRNPAVSKRLKAAS